MPVLRFIKRFVAVPDTWDGWAIRVLTIAVIITLCSSWILITRIDDLSDQLHQGRVERTASQEAQTVRLCAVIAVLDPDRKRDVGC